MNDINDINETNAHRALWLSETHVSADERSWFRWVKAVEAILGHDLDGNQKEDGYSLDYALTAHDDGLTAAEYVEEIRGEIAALGA